MFPIPSSWWLPIAGGVICVALLSAVGVQTVRLEHSKRELSDAQAAWSLEREKSADATRKQEVLAREEEQRRIVSQQAITVDAQRKVDAARADAVAATASSERLQQRIAALAASARQGPGNPATAGIGSATSDPGDLLAFLFSGANERSGELAQFADRAHLAGQECQQHYDALTSR